MMPKVPEKGDVGSYGNVDVEEDVDYFEGGVAFEELFEERWLLVAIVSTSLAWIIIVWGLP